MSDKKNFKHILFSQLAAGLVAGAVVSSPLQAETSQNPTTEKNGCGAKDSSGHKKKETEEAHKCGTKDSSGHKKKETEEVHKCGKNMCSHQ